MRLPHVPVELFFEPGPQPSVAEAVSVLIQGFTIGIDEQTRCPLPFSFKLFELFAFEFEFGE